MKIKRALVALMGFCMALSCSACTFLGGIFYKRPFDNVIVVIGDGMGENHILNALTYFDLDMPVFMADQKGYIKTDSLDGTTDSAAGGTALATGNKVFNGEIAQHIGEDLEQITSIAKKAKMKTGVITTDTLDGATPASFSAHASARGASTEIINTQITSGMDLLIGRYSSAYFNRSNAFVDAGYTYADTVEEMLSAKDSEKLISVLGNINSEYIATSQNHYQLKDMAKFAVEYLENDDGFFLMIEGAYIDKHSHNNYFNEAMSEVRSLIDTIEYLYEYASDGRTAIFITADHETGSLQAAKTKDECNNILYHSTNHSSTPVPLYVKNYQFDATKFGYKAGVTPENTVVFDACKKIITGK